MNKSRRKSIRIAAMHIDKALDIIRDAKYEEQDAIDNMPENMQNSERYEAMESAVDNLEDAIESLRDAQDYIDKAIA